MMLSLPTDHRPPITGPDPGSHFGTPVSFPPLSSGHLRSRGHHFVSSTLPVSCSGPQQCAPCPGRTRALPLSFFLSQSRALPTPESMTEDLLPLANRIITGFFFLYH